MPPKKSTKAKTDAAKNATSTTAKNEQILQSSISVTTQLPNIQYTEQVRGDDVPASPPKLAVQATDLVMLSSKSSTGDPVIPSSTIIFAGSHPDEIKSDLEDVADAIRCGRSECVATDKGFFVFLFDIYDDRETSRVFNLLKGRLIQTPLEAFKSCHLPSTLSRTVIHLTKWDNDDVGTQTSPELLVATTERAAQTMTPSNVMKETAEIPTQTMSSPEAESSRDEASVPTAFPQPPPSDREVQKDSGAPAKPPRRIERQHCGSNEILQCFRCCRFGHFSNTCRSPVRCNRCGGGHYHTVCKVPRDSPRCCHCSGKHASSYGGCPARREYLESCNNSKNFKYHDNNFQRPQETSRPQRRHHFDARRLQTLEHILESLWEVAANERPRSFKRKFERANRDPARPPRNNKSSETAQEASNSNLGAPSGHPATETVDHAPDISPTSQVPNEEPGTSAAVRIDN